MDTGYLKSNLTNGFPDGNEMIRINTAGFASIARGILNDPTSTPNEIADVNQWISKNQSAYGAATTGYEPTPETKSLMNYVQDLTTRLNVPYYLGDKVNGAIKSVDKEGVIAGYITKYGSALLAIIIGLILLAGAIYTYKGK